ncbi:SPOSA6832_00491 [Sporobolomyces salmonicolor]|uniref:SPOSA6832_00491-mRNA-1:cds n=1 Tax=Sporidiobolus salmonicolor TaxID=5005 RepID=A0A0D6EGT1_SPOSA|nr:SPOSA6832_00491 [Sporobolomyces salmonicolor]
MAQRESIDPFADTAPVSGYDTDILTATPATGGAGTATASGTAAGARSASQLSRASGRTGTSGKSAATPWHLKTGWIVALIVVLLIALGLGVGLGVGLGDKNNTSSSASVRAAEDGSGATITSYSTLSQIVTASASTTIVPQIVTHSQQSASVVIETIGGSTVTALTAGSTSEPLVTVSATLPPTTRTAVVYVLTYPSTETVTTTLDGGAESTYFATITVQSTVTAQATARRKRSMRTLQW